MGNAVSYSLDGFRTRLEQCNLQNLLILKELRGRLLPLVANVQSRIVKSEKLLKLQKKENYFSP